MYRFLRISTILWFNGFLAFHQARAQITAEEVCSRAASPYAEQCVAGLKPNANYDERALKYCANATSEFTPDCVWATADRYFQGTALKVCGFVTSNYLTDCINSIANKIFSEETIVNCRKQANTLIPWCFEQS